MKLKLTAALTFALATSFAHSQPVNPMLSKLSSLGGAVEATAKYCDCEIDAKSAREQQRTIYQYMANQRRFRDELSIRLR